MCHLFIAFKQLEQQRHFETTSLRFNNSMGQHFKKIYHCFFGSAATLDVVQSAYMTPTTVVSWYTSIDNDRRQQYNVTTALLEDWAIVQKQFPKKLISSYLSNYRNNYFICDMFSGEEDDLSKDVVDSGLDLTHEHKWDVIVNKNNSVFNFYTFAIVTRTLMISPQGIAIK